MNTSFHKPFTFDRVVRLIIQTIVIAGIIFALHYFRQVLLPFFIAWLLAYLFYPMVKFVRFKLRFKNNTLSVVTVLLVILGIIFCAFRFLPPMLISEFSKLKDILLSYTGNNGNELLPHHLKTFLQYVISVVDMERLLDPQNLIATGKELFPHAWELLSSSFSVLFSVFLFFIVLLYLFFILKDYDTITKEFLSLIPFKRRRFVSDLLRDMESGMNRYYRGQALVATIVGILFCIGFSIIGLPLALVMGLFIGVLNLVPYLQVISIPPTIILMLLHVAEKGCSPWWPLISLVLVYVIVQAIQDGYLVPKILGKTMGLNPAVILLALSIWGYLLGVLGMIIALPATTLLISYYKRFVLTDSNTNDDTLE